LINKIICSLAGRTSENIFKGYITSNGDEDLKKAKRIITFLVVKFGMSRLGKIGFPDVDYVKKPYSEET
jgi:ATP-dependent Zn protease